MKLTFDNEGKRQEVKRDLPDIKRSMIRVKLIQRLLDYEKLSRGQSMRNPWTCLLENTQ